MKFMGSACQCMNTLNRQTDTWETCSGHGECIEPKMPWGFCSHGVNAEHDDLMFSFDINDWTNEDFIKVIDNMGGATQDPTPLPTVSPTPFPTWPPSPGGLDRVWPTRKPSAAPTAFPSPAPT